MGRTLAQCELVSKSSKDKRNGNTFIEIFKIVVFYGNCSNCKFNLLKFCNMTPQLHIIKTYQISSAFYKKQ